MKLFLFLLAVSVAVAIVVPVQTGSQRCLVIYSMNAEDTIKIGLKFPNDARLQEIYDYRFKVRDLSGGVMLDQKVPTLSWRTEVAVPSNTIYEACIAIMPNETRASNTSVRFSGQVLVSYEADTHFMEGRALGGKVEGIREEEVLAMKSQVNDLINITRQFVELQRMQREEETREYQQKRQAEDSIFEWWMVELLLIAGLGLVQWNRMKHKLEADRP